MAVSQPGDAAEREAEYAELRHSEHQPSETADNVATRGVETVAVAPPPASGHVLMRKSAGRLHDVDEPAVETRETKKLPAELQERLGRAMGADFSAVRIHVGDGVAREHRADAVTLGADIHFDAGRYDPDSAAGQRLIAHELAHTIQQGAVPTLHPPLAAGTAHALEQEADHLAAPTVAGQRIDVALNTANAAAAAQRKATLVDEEQEEREAEALLEQHMNRVQAVDAGTKSRSKHKGAADRKDPQHSATEAPAPASQAPRMAGSDAIGSSAESSSHTAQAAPAVATTPSSGDGETSAGSSTVSTGNAAHGGLTAAMKPAGGATDLPQPQRVQSEPPRTKQQSTSANVGTPRPPGTTSAGSTGMAASGPPTASAKPQDAAVQALAQAVLQAGKERAETVRRAGETLAADVRAGLQTQKQSLAAQKQAVLAHLQTSIAAAQAQLTAEKSQASAALQREHAQEAQRVETTKQHELARIRADIQQAKQNATQEVTQQVTAITAQGQTQATRAIAQSEAHATQAQQDRSVAGGDPPQAEAQQQAAAKIGAKAADNFRRDGTQLSGEATRAATQSAKHLREQLTQFTAKLDEMLPKVTQSLEQQAQTVRVGMEHSLQGALHGIEALAGQTMSRLGQEHHAAVAQVETVVSQLEQRLESETEQALVATAPAVEETTAALLATAQHASAQVLASGSAERGQTEAAAAQAGLEQDATTATTHIGTIGRTLVAGLAKAATQGGVMLDGLAQTFATSLSQVTADIGSKLAGVQTTGIQGLAQAANRTCQAITESAAQASSEVAKAKQQFSHAVGDGTNKASKQLHQGVDSAVAKQAGHLRTAQSHKQSAASQIASRYQQLKSEAQSRSQSEQKQSGQASLWGAITGFFSQLTARIKKWFADTFGQFWGGLLFGILGALVGLVIVIAILALIAAVFTPFVALVVGIVALVAFAGLSIYSRWQQFKANNGRSPGFWEYAALVGLGIADVTGIPQIVEGAVGKRAFSNGHTMDDFERGESIGTGIVQLVALLVGGARILRGKPGTGVKPEVKPPEIKPPEVEIKPEVVPEQPIKPEVAPKDPAVVKNAEVDPNTAKDPNPELDPKQDATSIGTKEHVHQGGIETDPQSPYQGKWDGSGIHAWEGLVDVCKRDGYTIKEVLEDSNTGVRRVTIERIGTDPKTNIPVKGTIRKTIYPKKMTSAEIDAAGETAFEKAQAKELGTKFEEFGAKKKSDGSLVTKTDGTPVDGYFEATVDASDGTKIRIQGWYRVGPDGKLLISSHAPRFDKSWPSINGADW